MRGSGWLALWVGLLLPGAAVAQQARTETLRFDERHPESEISAQQKRTGWTARTLSRDPQRGRYEIAAQSFVVRLPAGYDENTPHGLLVWISPGPSGAAPGAWGAVADRERLIVIGADNSGNNRLIWYRIGLALDALHNARKRYAIDPERIYVSGFSGGGRTASRVAVRYADHFRGGLYCGGVDFYRATPVPDQRGKTYRANYYPPKGAVLSAARKRSRHVLLAGAKDFNAPQTRSRYTHGFKKAGFKHAHLVTPEGLAHQPPDGPTFAKALALLDAGTQHAKGKADEAE